MPELDPAIVEMATKVAYENQGVAKWADAGHTERELAARKISAALEAAAPLIASAAWQEGYQQAQLEAAHAIGGRCSSGNGICVQCSQGNPYEGGKS